MRAIVAADENWGIGLNNSLLVRIPADQRFFRKETTGKVVVMGRKTLESLPNGKPLADRTNIVLTSDRNYRAAGASVVHDLTELMEAVSGYDSDDVYVIGGAAVYRELLPYCDTVLLTKIMRTYEADVWFPDLDSMPGEWKLTARSGEQTYFDLEYYFLKYTRTGPSSAPV